jgi:hypothetical protein
MSAYDHVKRRWEAIRAFGASFFAPHARRSAHADVASAIEAIEDALRQMPHDGAPASLAQQACCGGAEPLCASGCLVERVLRERDALDKSSRAAQTHEESLQPPDGRHRDEASLTVRAATPGVQADAAPRRPWHASAPVDASMEKS